MQKDKNTDVLSSNSDCVWVILSNHSEDLTFTTTLLRELDWKSRGLLSRVLKNRKEHKETVFIPMPGKLPMRFCALDTIKSFREDGFEKNIEGLKAKNVFILFENEEVKKELEEKVSKTKFKNFTIIKDY